MSGAEGGMLLCLAILAGIDLRTKKIPLLPVVILGMLALGYRWWDGVSFWELVQGLLPGSLLLITAWATKESIGYGDGLVLVVLGLFFGMKTTFAALGMALAFASLLSIILLMLRRAGRKTELPFLPCLCSGYFLCFLW